MRINTVGYTGASNVVVVNATTTAESLLGRQPPAGAHWDQSCRTLAINAIHSRTRSFRQGMIHAVPFRTRQRVGKVGSGKISQDGMKVAGSQLSRDGGNDSRAIPAGTRKIGNLGIPLRTRFVRFRGTHQRPHVTRITSQPLPVHSKASRRVSDRGAVVS